MVMGLGGLFEPRKPFPAPVLPATTTLSWKTFPVIWVWLSFW